MKQTFELKVSELYNIIIDNLLTEDVIKEYFDNLENKHKLSIKDIDNKLINKTSAVLLTMCCNAPGKKWDGSIESENYNGEIIKNLFSRFWNNNVKVEKERGDTYMLRRFGGYFPYTYNVMFPNDETLYVFSYKIIKLLNKFKVKI